MQEECKSRAKRRRSEGVSIGRVHEDETSDGSNNRGVYAGYEA